MRQGTINVRGYNLIFLILLLSYFMSASVPAPMPVPMSDPITVASSTLPSSPQMTPAELALAEIVVKTLNLEVAASEIDPDAPIYGEGLGLDSIDILEISLAISKQYGFQLKSDDENNKTIYKSLRNLSAQVEKSRTK